MRLHVLSGGALAIAAALAVLVGASLGLEMEHVALLGLALGAVVGLVPQGRSLHRLLGFATGFALAWVGYLLRAAVLPDSTSGRAVAVLLVVVGCAVVHLLSRGRLPLWASLVGVTALVGAYEETYTAAPSQVAPQSMTAATAVLLAVALGYVVSTLFDPDVTAGVGPAEDRSAQDIDAQETTSVDEPMTESVR
jgi:hypothetical protein